MTGYANTLKEWTGKTTASVIYDSNVCPFTDKCLFQMVKGKPNVAIIATTKDGDVFGGFYNVAVTMQEKNFFDQDMFIFSFESHGRCKTPQRFVAKEDMMNFANVWFWKNDEYGRFVELNALGGFSLGNEKSKSCCSCLSRCFEGIEDTTLTGKKYFTCCRLVAIQLE